MTTALAPLPPATLAEQVRSAARTWAHGQYRLVVLAADFADSIEWVLDGSPSAAHWLAHAVDVETCTAREWIRVGRKLQRLPLISAAFESGEISYSKVRAITRLTTPQNEAQLLGLALQVPAGDLGRELARWFSDTFDPEEIDAHHQRSRSIRWRLEPDGMTTFTLRLPPLLAGALIAFLSGWVMKSRQSATKCGDDASAVAPTVAQQYVDALDDLIVHGGGRTLTEVVLHVRGDGCTLDDGTPIPGSVVERIAPSSFVRALITDADRRPVNVSSRRRHPSTRQKRFVKARDQVCIDCGRDELLEYDHRPAFEVSRHTQVDELVVRCTPCHRKRHLGEAG